MMIEVRNDVIQSTNGKQVPWDTSSLTGRFSFKIEGTVTVTPPPQGSTGPQTSPPPPDRAALELETWKRIRESGNAAVFQQFLEHYPDGIFAQLARDRVAALSIKSEPSAAPPVQGICWTGRNGQFFRAIHYCVSSVLAPQGGNTYGPEHLARWEGNSTKAWCEGVPGHGIGDTVTIRIEGAVAFRRLLVANGYGKSSRTYANNGRVKTVEITADTGIRAMQNFPDRSDILPIDLPKLAQHWIQLKIVDVYPGQRFTDTCLSFLMPDHEYEEKLLLKEQGLLPK
jgi:hypothetical protein